MMAMWTIGYSAADALAIAQTTTDQQGSTWVSRLMWVVMLSCLLAYAGWQSYLCYQSYHTPAWAYNVDRPASIRYPAVLICPLGYKSPHSLLTENTTCTYGVDNGDGDYNETNCGVKIVYLGQSKKGPLIVCVVANSEPDNQAVTWAYGNVHTYLEIGLAVNKNKSKAKNGALYPVQFSLFTQNTVKDYRALTHNFVAMPGNAFWGLVSKNQDVYLDGTTQDEYDVSVSSTRINDNTQLTATFSFTSFDVSQSTEYVYFDWLSLLGVLGGASSLAMAGHLLGMLMYEKGILHTYNWWKGRKYEELGDDQRALTELSVNGESERLMTMVKN